jgi:hypothetical protein
MARVAANVGCDLVGEYLDDPAAGDPVLRAALEEQPAAGRACVAETCRVVGAFIDHGAGRGAAGPGGGARADAPVVVEGGPPPRP